jgi:hypothetical protein
MTFEKFKDIKVSPDVKVLFDDYVLGKINSPKF